MNELNDGGPAFPAKQEKIYGTTRVESYDTGMSLRDWFAGQALSGLCSAHNEGEWTGASNTPVAKEAYIIADSMLKAREETSE